MTPQVSTSSPVREIPTGQDRPARVTNQNTGFFPILNARGASHMIKDIDKYGYRKTNNNFISSFKPVQIFVLGLHMS